VTAARRLRRLTDIAAWISATIITHDQAAHRTPGDVL
jgi:hypothetical protein